MGVRLRLDGWRRFSRGFLGRVSSLPWIRRGRNLGAEPIENAQIVDSTPPGLAPEGAVIGLPGFNFQPRGGIPVLRLEDADVASAGSANVITIEVPQNWEFKITRIGFGAENESALAEMTWNLTSNGNSVPHLVNLASVIGTILQPTPLEINIPGTSTLVLSITNTGLATRHFIARVDGYYFQTRVTKWA